MTPVRILNMGSGFAYGDVITVPDTALGVATASSVGNITFTLEHPTDIYHNRRQHTDYYPGWYVLSNPSGAVLTQFLNWMF